MLPPQLQTDPAWSPPEQDVRPAYQPVEVLLDDSESWALGRINAWWNSPEGTPWCRLRLIGASAAPAWRRYDPERILLLPTHGI
ncbi:hypothetical protein Kpho02_31580 [Kitasatospora phosalacinea]|uniref:Uncharacterized protein n=1 Tax=Kitasatospora phosalacinea TaxID=2065 RepID=A0A9W6Q6U7_9ACTN|nr:hypothetical protein [Kitasatospora phosalacinea]GLW70859.1 hypothetical protein Kpho02_31580 [Kitasatospora phosalacinea]